MTQVDLASVHTLPLVRLTRASQVPGEGFLPVDHVVEGQALRYWREYRTEVDRRQRILVKVPLILDREGRIWEPGSLWLLALARANPLKVSSLTSVAQGLREYKRYLDGLEVAWDDFSQADKYARPTYQYKTHLQGLVSDGRIANTTARSRMSTVIRLYRALSADSKMQFNPQNPPWIERRASFTFTNSVGQVQVREVATTDVSINASAQGDDFDGTITDGAKLRPLDANEQRALIAALKVLGNPEYELAHYAALMTGARVQTVLTLPWGAFRIKPSSIAQWPYKLRCGPGTGIDTKGDATNVYLVIPRDLYEMLHVYATSSRAARRRARSPKADDLSNYLFLTSHGGPYYESKSDLRNVPLQEARLRRSSPIGQNLREFIAERVIPEVRKTIPDFKYRFHDLRATFGINWIDGRVSPEGGSKDILRAREQLRRLMWHKRADTTDHYLEYRQNKKLQEEVHVGWSEELIRLIRSI